MSRRKREEWAPILEAETKRWAAKSAAELIAEIGDGLAYEVEYNGKPYQVEVEVLEDTAKYVHVLVAVDDGTLPASIMPATTSFIVHRES